MCIAHESEEYGVLSIGGKAMTTQQIARAVGESPAMVAKLLDELGDARVFSRDDKGSIFSRRMVKDERIRNVRAEAGRLGGNPDLLGKKVKQKDKQNEEQNLTPSSSSSSSSSNTPPNPQGGYGRFPEFWATWPKSSRKASKGECEKLWGKAKLDSEAEAILAHVQHMASSQDWLKEGGAYIPAPLVYLRGKRWDGADIGDQTESIFAGGV